MLDISLSRQRQQTCAGNSRRDFLRVGGLGAFGLSLASLLRSEAHGATRVEPVGHGSTAKTARAKNCILIFLGGGLSHHDSFDLKPEASEEIRGKYKPIETNVPGTLVGELLPRMAKSMDRVTLVRSGSHNNDHHETATNWVLSGRFGSPFGDYPAIGAVVSHQFGFTDVLPPYVSLPRNPSFTWELGKSAFLGGRFESFKTGDPNEANFAVRDLALPSRVTEKNLNRRQSLLQAVDHLAEEVQGSDLINTYDEFRQRAATMVTSADARTAFVVDQESPHLRDRYGRTTFGQSCLLARRLIERGVRFATVNFGGWDHHGKIWNGLENRLPDLDQGLSALLEDMQQRGLLNDTLVVVMGEFGRTPKINKDVGRDHWGQAASLLFAGAGTAAGKVIGATDKDGAYVTRSPVSPADVAYTIFDTLGIDPRSELHTPDGRPLAILDEGRVIPGLFG